MALTSWIVLGFFAGGISGWITGRRARGCVSRIVIGVIGAIVGGALARAAGVRGLTGLSIRSLLVATLGASLLLFLLQAIEGRRR